MTTELMLKLRRQKAVEQIAMVQLLRICAVLHQTLTKKQTLLIGHGADLADWRFTCQDDIARS